VQLKILSSPLIKSVFINWAFIYIQTIFLVIIVNSISFSTRTHNFIIHKVTLVCYCKKEEKSLWWIKKSIFNIINYTDHSLHYLGHKGQQSLFNQLLRLTLVQSSLFFTKAHHTCAHQPSKLEHSCTYIGKCRVNLDIDESMASFRTHRYPGTTCYAAINNSHCGRDIHRILHYFDTLH
jgi:hypothetical protein